MKKFYSYLSVLLLSILVTGCGSSNNDDNAYLRVLHASPDAPNVDVLLDGSAVLTNVPFQAGTGYLMVDAGTRQLSLRVTGTSTIALTQSLALSEDGYYSVIAQNEVADLGVKFIDDTGKMKNGTIDVSVAHASPGAGNVDIYVSAAGSDISGVEPNFNDVVIGQDTGYVPLAPAVYDVTIAADGTKTPAVPGTSGLTFADGDIVTAIAVGNSAANLAPIVLNDAR